MSKSNHYYTINQTRRHLSVLVEVYICSVLLIVSSSAISVTRDESNPLPTSNTFSYARSSSKPQQAQAATFPTSASMLAATLVTKSDSTTLRAATQSSGFQDSLTNTITPQPRPQKSLKFTLISGKYWKFNIKTNSLQTSHGEKELRLHRNVSANNFIIDDDGWFQYNHQQQQLFAWPSYNVKLATYYFVLLPSGLDYEADGENVIKSGDVVANIIVELIEPYTTSKLDLDHLVDHKFSLEYLHRHSSYPLLLTQIVSIFDLLARNTLPSNSLINNLDTTISPSTETAVTTTNSVLAALQQNKQARLSSRLSEFLLIDAFSSQDGEFFSITWTTHPSLINNAPILPINDCRLSTINETLSKLSSRSILYPNVDDKFVISYSLEGPLVNSNAIVPTERGNYALKLFLNSPCRRKKILNEIGLDLSAPGVFIGLVTDADDKENIVVDQTESRIKAYQAQTTTAISLSSRFPTDRIAAKESTVTASTQVARDTITNGDDVEKRVRVVYGAQTEPTVTSITPTLAGSTPHGQSPAAELQNTITNTRRALEKSTTQGGISEVQSSPSLLQIKSQPQAKSFVNFLETTSNHLVHIMMDNTTSNPNLPANSIQGNTTTSSTVTYNANATTSTVQAAKGGQESSLNDDLIEILNETMDFLVSIAVPLSIVLGIMLIASILIAICNLCIKKRKSKQFEVGDRFKFRYGSERKGFLKNSSKPVILEADQKSLSMGGTPMRKPNPEPNTDETDPLASGSKLKSAKREKKRDSKSNGESDFFSMSVFSSDGGRGRPSG